MPAEQQPPLQAGSRLQQKAVSALSGSGCSQVTAHEVCQAGTNL